MAYTNEELERMKISLGITDGAKVCVYKDKSSDEYMYRRDVSKPAQRANTPKRLACMGYEEFFITEGIKDIDYVNSVFEKDRIHKDLTELDDREWNAFQFWVKEVENGGP